MPASDSEVVIVHLRFAGCDLTDVMLEQPGQLNQQAGSWGVNSCQRGVVWHNGVGIVRGGGLAGGGRVMASVFLRDGETLLTPACQLQENRSGYYRPR